jgi:hypothetical protein
MAKRPDAGGDRGSSMSGLEKSPKRRKLDAAKRKAEEAAWAAKSGAIFVDELAKM